MTTICESETAFVVSYFQGGEAMIICDFGAVLKELRTARNLTQTELGRQLGLSKAVVSKYENGISYPTFDILIGFAKYFGVSTDYLLGVSKNKTIDVSLLTESQIDTVYRVIAEFNKANR